MNDDVSNVALDGNAAGSLLQKSFLPDITSAQIQCRACDFTSQVGSMRLYGAAMGAVLRCAHCDCILMRAVHTRHGRWLEVAGARHLRFS
jgi:hypothetical protein